MKGPCVHTKGSRAQDTSVRGVGGSAHARDTSVLAQGSPIFRSSCEGKLGIALE